MGTARKTAFSVTLRRTSTGEECVRTILADDEATAKIRALEKVRAKLSVFADRRYAKFEVLSCRRNER